MLQLHGHAMRGKQTHQMIELRDPGLAGHIGSHG
jgi:hypothetical protein